MDGLTHKRRCSKRSLWTLKRTTSYPHQSSQVLFNWICILFGRKTQVLESISWALWQCLLQQVLLFWKMYLSSSQVLTDVSFTFRVHHAAGCPSQLPCCSEFGYCRTMVGPSWTSTLIILVSLWLVCLLQDNLLADVVILARSTGRRVI